MSKLKYTVALKPIGKIIKPYELVAIKNQDGKILVYSLKTNEQCHISKKDKYSHLCEEYLHDWWFRDNATETITTGVEKYGLFKRKSREIMKQRFADFADSPFTKDVMHLVAGPAQVLLENYPDMYQQFYKTFDHIIAMCETLCKNYKYLNQNEIEQKINDAAEIVKSHFHFAVEVVERNAVNSIQNTYSDILKEQGVILDAYKSTVDRLNGIDPDVNKMLDKG